MSTSFLPRFSRVLIAATCLTGLALTSACQPFWEAPGDPPPRPAASSSLDIYEVQLPTAPWDSFVVRYDADAQPADETLTVRGPDGQTVSVEPAPVRPGTLEFVPSSELEPGRYVVVEALGVELDPQPESEVLPWGTDFELPAPGDAILLDVEGAELVNPPGIASLLASALDGDLLVEFLDAEDAEDPESAGTASDERPFRVVLAADDGACVVHESTAHETSEGTLTDIHPILDYDAGPAFGQLYGVQLELAFWRDRVRTRRASAVADTAALGPWVTGQDDPYGLCDLVAAFGVPCQSCPVGDTDTCVDVEVRSLEGERVALPWAPGAAIAECNGPGQPLSLDIEPIECGCDAGGGLSVLWLGLLAIPLVRRR